MMRKTLSGMRWLWIALPVPVLAWTVPSAPRSPPPPRVVLACLPGDQLAIVGHHAGHCPAELRHAGSDLDHLIGAMDLGIAGVGAQPVDRPRLNLARCKDQIHGVAFIWGRAGTPMRAGSMASNKIGVRDIGENESAGEGIPAGAKLRWSRYE